MARENGLRGLCKTGIEYSFYNRQTEEQCASCEIYGQMVYLSAETCPLGDGPWPEDKQGDEEEEEEIVYTGRLKPRSPRLVIKKSGDEGDAEDGGAKVR